MPKAVVDPNATQRYDLKTLPPDGYVVLRRMTYDERLLRKQRLMRMSVRQNTETKQDEGELALADKSLTEWAFANLIIEHNCEDEDGEKLDFKKKDAFKILDPRVGEEIDGLIMSMNNLDDADTEVPNL